MEQLLSLLALLIKKTPSLRLGELLLTLVPTTTDLRHIPNETLESRIKLALMNNLTVQPRRLVMPIGLPGSGKSTLALQMARDRPEGTRAVICSTDDFFVVNGDYKFNPGKLGEYHARNFQKFALALADGVELVIIDNTNLREEHREPYLRLAKAMGYTVEMPVVGEFTPEACQTYAGRNVHGVPLEGLRRMAQGVQVP
jgi:predicted kinase